MGMYFSQEFFERLLIGCRVALMLGEKDRGVGFAREKRVERRFQGRVGILDSLTGNVFGARGGPRHQSTFDQGNGVHLAASSCCAWSSQGREEVLVGTCHNCAFMHPQYSIAHQEGRFWPCLCRHSATASRTVRERTWLAVTLLEQLPHDRNWPRVGSRGQKCGG